MPKGKREKDRSVSSAPIKKRPRSKIDRKITPQQRAFVDELMKDPACEVRNAAKAVGVSGPTGNRWIKEKGVQEALGDALARRAEKNRITADEVLKELVNLGFSNPKRLFDEEGNVKPLKEWADEDARCVQDIEFETKAYTAPDGEERIIRVIRRIKLWPKLPALEMVAKHLGMLNEKLQLTGTLKHEVGPELLHTLLERVEKSQSVMHLEDMNVVEGQVIHSSNKETEAYGNVISSGGTD